MKINKVAFVYTLIKATGFDDTSTFILYQNLNLLYISLLNLISKIENSLKLSLFEIFYLITTNIGFDEGGVFLLYQYLNLSYCLTLNVTLDIMAIRKKFIGTVKRSGKRNGNALRFHLYTIVQLSKRRGCQLHSQIGCCG